MERLISEQLLAITRSPFDLLNRYQQTQLYERRNTKEIHNEITRKVSLKSGNFSIQRKVLAAARYEVQVNVSL